MCAVKPLQPVSKPISPHNYVNKKIERAFSYIEDIHANITRNMYTYHLGSLYNPSQPCEKYIFWLGFFSSILRAVISLDFFLLFRLAGWLFFQHFAMHTREISLTPQTLHFNVNVMDRHLVKYGRKWEKIYISANRATKQHITISTRILIECAHTCLFSSYIFASFQHFHYFLPVLVGLLPLLLLLPCGTLFRPFSRSNKIDSIAKFNPSVHICVRLQISAWLCVR